MGLQLQSDGAIQSAIHQSHSRFLFLQLDGLYVVEGKSQLGAVRLEGEFANGAAADCNAFTPQMLGAHRTPAVHGLAHPQRTWFATVRVGILPPCHDANGQSLHRGVCQRGSQAAERHVQTAGGEKGNRLRPAKLGDFQLKSRLPEIAELIGEVSSAHREVPVQGDAHLCERRTRLPATTARKERQRNEPHNVSTPHCLLCVHRQEGAD